MPITSLIGGLLYYSRPSILCFQFFFGIIIRYSVTASTVRFHRADPGSTPGIGDLFLLFTYYTVNSFLFKGYMALTIYSFKQQGTRSGVSDGDTAAADEETGTLVDSGHTVKPVFISVTVTISPLCRENR